MIDPAQLAFDTIGNAVAVVLPGLLWAGLFLVAFERGPAAESVGFGRRTFWLLLPAAVAVSLANLPFVPISDDVLGISLGGAVFPIVVALGTLRPLAAPGAAGRAAAAFLGGFGAIAAVALGIVVWLPAPLPSSLGVLAVAALVPGAVYALGVARGDATIRRVGGLLGLTAGVLLLTFLFSSATPDLGITEGFPQYLLPPVAAGFVAAIAAPRLLRGAEGLALPVAYAAATFGVLAGADILREPPLYPSAAPGLYVIGGAGVLDLVYLSGLLAFVAAVAGLWWLRIPWGPLPGAASTDPPPTPVAQLGGAFRRGLDGDLPGSLAGATGAARSAAREAALLLELPPPPEERPWQGVPVPGWVVSDQANLDAVVRRGAPDGRESYRGWLTGRLLVAAALPFFDRRFASAGQRTAAFLVDLALVTAPAIVVWALIAARTPGGLLAVAAGVPFNAAIYGYISLAFAYFVVGEYGFGTTVGKRLFGLSVRDRRMARPELRAVLVRNAFRTPALSVVGVTVATAVALLVTAPGSAALAVEGFGLPAGTVAAAILLAVAVAGVGLLGVVGYLSIGVTSERQRWGDLVAGTWVVRPLSRTAAGTAAPVGPVPAAAPPGPSG